MYDNLENFPKVWYISFLLHAITISNFLIYITDQKKIFKGYVKAFKCFKNCISIVPCPGKDIECASLSASYWEMFHNLCMFMIYLSLQ